MDARIPAEGMKDDGEGACMIDPALGALEGFEMWTLSRCAVIVT